VFFGISTGWLLILIIPLLTLGPLFSTALYAVNQLIENRNLSFKKIYKFFIENFWRSFFAFLFTLVLYAVLIVDLRFFLVRGADNLWLLIFAFLFGYLIIYLTIYQSYLWGLLVLQKNKPLKNIFKNSLILSLDNIIFSLLWFLAMIIITIILAATGVGIAGAFIGIIGLLILEGSQEMLGKY